MPIRYIFTDRRVVTINSRRAQCLRKNVEKGRKGFPFVPSSGKPEDKHVLPSQHKSRSQHFILSLSSDEV